MKNPKHLLTAVFALVGSITVFAQPKLIEKVEQEPGKYVIPYEKWELPNGLTVYLHEDHSDPIVHLDVTYHVGSARESIGKSGFAHFFEHMMFQGSENVGDEMHFKYISEAGGTLNGTTNRDRTNYFETVPANYLEMVLWLEADRMGFLLDSVTRKKFENQRSTVKNEKGQNVENQPYGMVRENLFQNLYPQGHPYSWDVIGYVDDLDRADENDLKNFFMRWYGPNNASVVIAGDIDTKQALAWVEKYFGPIPRGPEVRKQRVERVNLPADKYVNMKDNIFLPLTLMVYPTVPAFHKDEPALQFLADELGNGVNSILYKNLVKTDSAIQVGAFSSHDELAGEFYIQALAYPNLNTKSIEEAMRRSMQEFEKTGISDEKLNAFKAMSQKQIIDELESINGKASGLAYLHYMLGGRKYTLQEEIDRYNSVTKEDVMAVYNRYIKGKFAVVVNVLPYGPGEKEPATKSFNPNKNIPTKQDPTYDGLTYKKPTDNFDRSKKPEPATPVAVAIPEFYEAAINGVKIIGTVNKETPSVTILMNIKGGHMLEDDRTLGLSSITAAMMNEGTVNYTTEKISLELDKLGSSISFSGGVENTQVVIDASKDKLDQTFALLKEKLFNPKFDNEDFKRVKKRTLEGLKNEKTQASLTANKVFTNLVYGNNVIGLPVNGYDRTVSKFKVEDCREFYDKYYAPNVTAITIVGDVSKDEILKKLEFLNEWKTKNIEFPKISSVPKHDKPTIYLVDKMNAAQTEIRVGKIAIPYDATGDYFKSSLMNFALGGNFNSRINLNLREDKGWTYGARSLFTGTEYIGRFTVAAGVKKNATDSALREILAELDKYRKDGITEKELDFTKKSYLSSEALKYETPFQKASFLYNIVRYNLPKDYVEEQKRILTGLSKTEVDALAKKYISADNMVIVVVGDEFFIKKPLEKLGIGTVQKVDPEKPLKLDNSLQIKN